LKKILEILKKVTLGVAIYLAMEVVLKFGIYPIVTINCNFQEGLFWIFITSLIIRTLVIFLLDLLKIGGKAKGGGYQKNGIIESSFMSKKISTFGRLGRWPLLVIVTCIEPILMTLLIRKRSFILDRTLDKKVLFLYLISTTISSLLITQFYYSTLKEILN